MVRRLDAVYYTLDEVSEGLGIPIRTLHHWRNRFDFDARPSQKFLFEGHWVYLYTPEDVERVRMHREEIATNQPARFMGGVGRPMLWTAREKADRNRRNAAAGYWTRRSDALREQNRPEEAQKASEAASALRHGLQMDARARRQALRKRIF